jgi:hypothetical protein
VGDFAMANNTLDSPRKIEPIKDRPVNQDPSQSNPSKSQQLTSGSLARVSVESSTIQLKVPFGWSWMWRNGISLLFELGGPVVVFNKDSGMTIDGENEGVNKVERDIVIAELESELRKEHAFSPYLSIGYSF